MHMHVVPIVGLTHLRCRRAGARSPRVVSLGNPIRLPPGAGGLYPRRDNARMSNILLDTKVRDVMTTPVLTIDQDAKISVAIELMRQHDIRRLPVLGRANRLVGMITLDDARLAMPPGVPFHGAEGTADVPDVRRVMSHGAITVGADDSIALAAQRMVNRKVGALPVLENGEMVGILTESDIFEFVARDLPPQLPESEFE